MRLLGEKQNGLKSLYIYDDIANYQPLARIEGEKGKEKLSYFQTNLAGLPEQLTDKASGQANPHWHFEHNPALDPNMK